MTEIKDPIAFELFKNAIFSIADEMALTIVRTTYSGVLRDNMDFSTALTDGDGRLVAQGLTIPGHLGSIPTAIGTILERYGADMGDGDIYAMNDPYDGGMHLPDIYIVKPIYVDGERLAFGVSNLPPHRRRRPGGGIERFDSTEIYQEGLRIPALKLYEHGKPNDTLFALIERNVRVPVVVFGDLRAQLAACHIAEKQFAEIVARYGPARVRELMDETIDYAERRTRAALAELPDGTVTFEDWIDDDGVDVGKPIRLFVTVTKKGDTLRADWTGSSDQVKGAINGTYCWVKAATYCAVKSVLPLDIPNNEGVFRPIEVFAPEGTIANAVPPAAVAARGLTGFRLVDCMFGALAMLLPDRVFAAGGRRQYRHFHRRLQGGPIALHLCRLHCGRLGRAAVGRWVGRQFQHDGQHVLAFR